jgi:hypothetical protein
MINTKKYFIIKYSTLAVALGLLIWQIIDLYIEITTFPVNLGERNYVVITVIISVILYLITNHKDFLVQHIISSNNVLLSLYNLVVLGLAYKISPSYISAVSNSATIFAHTKDEAVDSMKTLLIVILIILIAISAWYMMVVYHNKIEREQS